MTTPGLRWPASSVTASVSGHVCSASLFEDRFGRPGKGNDKGKVEGIVGYCRVPHAKVRNFDDLNTHQALRHDGRNNCVATTRRSANAWNGIVRAPSRIAYDACDKRPGRVSSLSLVRYRRRQVLGRHTVRPLRGAGHVHEVVISCAAEVIARHPRSARLLRCAAYLSLLEQKTNALDHLP